MLRLEMRREVAGDWRAIFESGDRREAERRLRQWTSVFPNPRLCKALLDRITDRAHIIETGTESFRFKRTMEGRKKK